LLGAGLALLWLTAYGVLFQAPAEDLKNRTVRLEAVVTDWPEATDYGLRVPVKAGEGDGRKVSALLYCEGDMAGLEPGDALSCVAYCQSADRVRGEESLYYTSRGIQIQIQTYGEVNVTPLEGFSLRYAPALLAGSLRDLIDQLYPADQTGFMKAVLTGDKSGLTDLEKNTFNRVGLGHVVVISGLHVSYLLGFLSVFFKRERESSLVVLLLALVAFSLVTGNAPGTVRAVILGGLVLVAWHLGRDTHPMTALSLGLLVLLGANPYAIANAGLQFSFLATAGIFLLGHPWLEKWRKGIPKKHRRWAMPVLSIFAVSLGAMVFTVPLSALYFGRFSLIAPLSNLLVGWTVSLVFAGGLVSLVLGGLWLPLGQAVAWLVGLPLDLFFWYSEQASRWTWAALATGAGYFGLWAAFVYGLILLGMVLPGRKRLVVPVCACVVTLCLSALLTAQTAQRTGLTVTILDVGQGQSILLNSKGTTALVDCGGTTDPGDTAATHLQNLGKDSLDLLILTHYHDDHAGGVPELLHRVEVKAMVLPDVEEDSPLRQEIERLAKSLKIPVYYVNETSTAQLGQAELTFHPPLPGSEAANERCLSMVCTYGDWDALITGDMPEEEERRLAARGVLPDCELLVAGHHGSASSTGQALLDTITPEMAVISVGYNTYGHPAQETLDRLAASHTETYRTDRHGTVTVYAKEVS
ncbi:MAG: DNA internalization-related competence protein ComEC/Rec2, partial [Ruminiclostridium sp.]|nr:DNA internalization-related competence protein ComEC/Rec2 [Ruminiclostridium sp.]